MARVYVPIDVGFFGDSKVLEVSPLARLEYVACLTVAKRQETDGVVTLAQLRREQPDVENHDELVAELLAQGLLQQGVDCRSSFVVVSFLRWNKSRAELDEYRANQAAHGRQGGQLSGDIRRVKGGPKGDPSESTKGDPSAPRRVAGRVDEGLPEPNTPHPTTSEDTTPHHKTAERRARVIERYIDHQVRFVGGVNNPDGLATWIERTFGAWLDDFLERHPTMRPETVGDRLADEIRKSRATRRAGA